MSDADRAYAEAQEQIAQAARTGAVELVLNAADFYALERLPPQIAELTGLQTLALDSTRITDLTPLSGLTGLRWLVLDHTGITDLTPLSDLTGLRSLGLDSARITDLTPLSGLTGLQTLDLCGTKITDLTPLSNMSTPTVSAAL